MQPSYMYVSLSFTAKSIKRKLSPQQCIVRLIQVIQPKPPVTVYFYLYKDSLDIDAAQHFN